MHSDKLTFLLCASAVTLNFKHIHPPASLMPQLELWWTLQTLGSSIDSWVSPLAPQLLLLSFPWPHMEFPPTYIQGGTLIGPLSWTTCLTISKCSISRTHCQVCALHLCSHFPRPSGSCLLPGLLYEPFIHPLPSSLCSFPATVAVSSSYSELLWFECGFSPNIQVFSVFLEGTVGPIFPLPPVLRCSSFYKQELSYDAMQPRGHSPDLSQCQCHALEPLKLWAK
jgi:hypothetical protein